MVLGLAVPPLGGGRALLTRIGAADRPTSTLERELNEDQAAATDAIRAAAGTFAAFLLQGVTGSGKTDVFLAAADTAIARGGQVLLLVPEINLTPQLETRVRNALPSARAVTLHSGLADGERRANWSAAWGGDAQFVLGTRLA